MQIAPWVFPLTEETASVPRMCGEKLSAVFTSCINLGSPPRVRGKERRSDGRILQSGITPACAGKSKNPRHHAAQTGDHPRVCGEKALQSSTHFRGLGSPPRVRGKVPQICAECWDRRITPACAGKRKCQGSWRFGSQDHPRVCGEKPSAKNAEAFAVGSPPRVRGKD